MSASSKHLVERLGRHPVFTGLGVEALEAVVADGTEIHLGDLEVLYESGDRADQVFVLLTGAIQIEYPAEGQKRGKVTAVLLSPHFLGEAQVLNDRVWSGTGVAVTDLVALGIKKARFLALIQAHPALALGLYLELTARFLNAIESWRHEPSHKPDQQVARYLLARRTVLQELEVDARTIRIKQVDLARAVGVRAETVNRILSRWQKEGVIGKVGEALELTDLARHDAIAESAPTPPLIQRCRLPAIV